MDVIELAAEKPKPEFKFRYGRTPGKMLFETHDLVIGYDEPLSKPLNFTMERGQKIALVGTNGIGNNTSSKPSWTDQASFRKCGAGREP